VEAPIKECVRFMLNHIKEQWAENAALKTILRVHRDPQTRAEWEFSHEATDDKPEPKKEIDNKFDPHIEKIMKALEDQEAVLTLLPTPTKGLPN